MTIINENNLNTIGLVRKIEKADCDIKKIDAILNDSRLFHHKADALCDELNKNSDYTPYIIEARMANGMIGNTPFQALHYYQKRKVFVVIKEAIKVFISKELSNKALKN